MDLFNSDQDSIQNEDLKAPASAPLASRLRPLKLSEIVGQEHLLGPGKLLRRVIESDRLTSLILYGPPGSGKTTLARVISKMTGARFKTLNAVMSSVQEIRKILEEARVFSARQNLRTLLFIDEIHRFNKAQQDVLMPDVEEGIIVLIGSTTHNPSFSINGPLLSRSLIFELTPLSESHIIEILKRAVTDPKRGLGFTPIQAEPEALKHLAIHASGDARRALNALEVGVLSTPPASDGIIYFSKAVAEESCQRRIVYYDQDEDYHYDTASAFIKSMRGSDPDASVYWLAKMLYAGEDPRFIVRRILILASEDIGNADPQALVLASAGMQAIEFIGLPEARIVLSQLVTYMALAPKSNASYLAIERATNDVQKEVAQKVPVHLRDKSYAGAKRMGHGEGYDYVHKHQDHYAKQVYVARKGVYYQPTKFGYEKVHLERLEELKKLGS